MLGTADVTDDELNTVMASVEGLLNNRPLGYQSADASDPTPLTPNHFLQGMAGEQMAPDPTGKAGIAGLRRRWRRVQEMVLHFWHRWQKEILPALHPRSKWRVAQRDLAKGDVVLVVEPDQPRGKWSLGRITEVYPGPDNHVRAVDVETRGTVYRRPIQRVCPLDVNLSTD